MVVVLGLTSNRTEPNLDENYIPAEVRNWFRGVLGKAKDHSFTKQEASRRIGAYTAFQKFLYRSRTLIEHEDYERFLKYIVQRVRGEAPYLLQTKLKYANQGFEAGTQSLSFENELKWAIHVVALNAAQLSEYRKLVNRLEFNIWQQSQSRCFSALEEIEQLTGDCIWLIEARTACLQMFNGLEKQKRWIDQIKKSSRRSLSAFVAHYISIRNEPTVSPSRFKSRARQNIEAQSGQEDFKAYLLFKLLDEFPSTKHGLASILRVAQKLNVFDLYEAVLAILQIVVSDDNFEHLRTDD